MITEVIDMRAVKSITYQDAKNISDKIVKMFSSKMVVNQRSMCVLESSTLLFLVAFIFGSILGIEQQRERKQPVFFSPSPDYFSEFFFFQCFPPFFSPFFFFACSITANYSKLLS